MPKIGVILDERQEIASFTESMTIAIFEKKESNWIKTKELQGYLKQQSSILEIRQWICQLVKELENCKILVGTMITGIPYMILDKEGFMLCEAKIKSHQLLEEISYDYTRMLQEKKQVHKIDTKEYPTSPFGTKEEGVFELDLRKLQKCHPQISSKMALIPFLKQAKFYQLNVYCNHVIPWLSHETCMKVLIWNVNQLEKGGYQICIQQAICEEEVQKNIGE